MIKKLTLLIALAFVMAGCATTNGTQAPAFVAGKAVVFINDSLINYPKASGSIRGVDDKVISTYWTVPQPNSADLNPGKHRVVVAFYSRGYGANAAVEGVFESGHVYEVMAVKDEGRKFDILLIDKSENDAVMDKSVVYGALEP